MTDDEVLDVSAASTSIQRECTFCGSGGGLCPECAEEEESVMQRKSVGSTVTQLTQGLRGASGDGKDANPLDQTYVDNLEGSGDPLPGSVRTYFEPRFGFDFSRVRVHKDNQAAESAREVNALAYTVGLDVVFGNGEYEPATPYGQRLLAHELVHVVQQTRNREYGNCVTMVSRKNGRGSCTSVIIILPNSVTFIGDRGAISASIVTDLTPGDYTIRYEAGKDKFVIDPWPTEDIVLNVSLTDRSRSEIETYKAYRDSLSGTVASLHVAAASSGSEVSLPGGGESAPIDEIPIDVTYSLVGSPSGFELPPHLARSTLIGGARGLGYLLSPPIRSWYDPLLPLSTRLGPGRAPLGSSGGAWTLERYLGYDVRTGLRPRFPTEGGELALRELTGSSEWFTRYGIRSRDLETLPGLIARMSEGGMDTLAVSEQALLRSFFRAHAEGGLVFASPAMSATSRAGLSGVEGVAPFLREAPYVVRIEVPSSAVADVNAVLGAERSAHLVKEIEVLVTMDARGNVTNVRPNPTSSLGRSTGYLRWGGKAVLVVGIGISAYRIGTASKEELPRVIGEEAGGWTGGLGGAALVAGGCIAFGIASGGIGLFLCGLAGGIAGGIGGSYVGGEIGEHAGSGSPFGSRSFESPIFRCFTGDTQVSLWDGSCKPISEMKIGDEVKSFDEHHKRISTSRVTKVFENPSQDYLKILVEEDVTIKVTPSHKVFANGSWTKAGLLSAGDSLLWYDHSSDQLSPRRVKWIKKERAGPLVYDFSVNPYHTYFAEGVLAHNKLP